MTSKISFFKLMQEDIKRKMWLLVLAVLVFFVSFPVVTMLWMDNIGRYTSYLSDYEIQQRAKDAFFVLLGYENIWMVVITTVGAVLCGIFSFSYLYKKKKVDFYHSIPVRREKLFFVSYLNGLLIYIVPYFITILICVLIGSRYVPIDSVVWGVVLREFGVQVLYYLLLYHTTILASILAGNMFGCLFLNGIAQFYIIFVYGIFIGYCGNYFDTYTSFSENFYGNVISFSPIVAFFRGIERLSGGNALYILRLNEGDVSIKLYLMQCFLVAILILGIAVYLYRIRSSEMSGKAIAFKKIQPVIRILLVIPSAMTGGLIFENLTDYNKIGWMLFGILFAAFLGHGVIEVLYQSDIRGMFSQKIQLAGTIVITVGIALAFRNDWFGYDSYVPKMEKIESAAISINGIGNEAGYIIEDSMGGSYTISSSTYVMERMKLTGDLLPVVQQLMSLGAYAQEERTDRLSTNWVDFYVKVRLKGGKEVVRFYSVSLDSAYDLLNTVFQSQEYKEKTYAYFLEHGMEAEVEIGGMTDWQELSKKESVEFLEIYQKELMALTLDDLRDYPAIGRVNYEIMDKNERARYRGGELSLYPAMTESLDYLEKIGILEKDIFLVQPKAEDIVALQIWDYYKETDPYGNETFETTGSRKVEVTDREQIQKLCERIYLNNGWNWNSLFFRGCQYDVEIVLDPELEEKYFGMKYMDVMFQNGDEMVDALMEELIRDGVVVE